MLNKTIYKNCYGICPLTSTEEKLTITYKAVPVIGQQRTAYKLVSASCSSDNSNDCVFNDNCPVLSLAEKVIYE